MFLDCSHSERVCHGDHGSQLNTSLEWVIDIAIFWSFDRKKLYSTPLLYLVSSPSLSFSFSLLPFPSFVSFLSFTVQQNISVSLSLHNIAGVAPEHFKGTNPTHFQFLLPGFLVTVNHFQRLLSSVITMESHSISATSLLIENEIESEKGCFAKLLDLVYK